LKLVQPHDIENRIFRMPSRTRPIEKFAEATAKCTVEASTPNSVSRLTISNADVKSCQAAAYGKCILADYTAVRKDMCAKEFMQLKDCYLVILALP
jgi:hypothetical protein